MQSHLKIWIEFFKTTPDQALCPLCGKKGLQIHHIDARGMGGTKREYTIYDLIGLCPPCHLKYGDIKRHKALLKLIQKDLIKKYEKR